MEQISRDYSNSHLVKYLSDRCFTIRDVYESVGSLFDYSADITEQTYRTPLRLVSDGFGNCVDASIMVSSILVNKNIPHKLVFGGLEKNKAVHVWVECGGFLIDCVAGRNENQIKFCKNKFNQNNILPYISEHEIF